MKVGCFQLLQSVYIYDVINVPLDLFPVGFSCLGSPSSASSHSSQFQPLELTHSILTRS